jgi:pseudouridine kinase
MPLSMPADRPIHSPHDSPEPLGVTVVGGANMDVGAQTDTPLLPGDSTPGHIHYAPGGVGRNIAENLARLGVPVQLVSVVGDDAFGVQLIASTAAVGVDMSATVRLPGQRTATYLSMHGPDGDMALAVNDMAILERVTPAFCSQHLPAQAPGMLQLMDCNLPEATLAYLLGLERESVVDGVSVAKCQRVRHHLQGLFLLKGNRLEAQAWTGLAVNTPEEGMRAAQALHSKGVQRVVVSLGGQGVCWCDADGVASFQAAREVPVVNTTGAGDALLAGIVAALQRQLPLARAVQYGMACAEITLSSTFANSAELSHAAALQHLQAVTPM